ncbi:RCC1 domain-containing protein [Actinokineospora sp. G85]|uniref:RCC1 domain-containing protein n=1 Tax=Actinokineospora sp. G85 TaxID=3406626 RepID=UPI003C778F6B
MRWFVVIVLGLAWVVAPGSQAAAQAAPSGFTPVSPTRVVDTRLGGGAVGPAGTLRLDLSGQVPVGTSAVVLNLTGVDATGATYLAASPFGSPHTTSNLNLVPGQTRANLVTVIVDSARQVAVYNNAGHTHVVADLTGYYSPAGQGRYTPLTQQTIVDTRDQAKVGQAAVLTVDLGKRVPRGTTAVTFTLTGYQATTATYVTAWPSGTPRPTTSNINVPNAAGVLNLVTIPIGADGKVLLFNHSGSIHLRVAFAGFHTPSAGALFTPTSPTRVLDTRTTDNPVTAPAYPPRAVALPGKPAGAVGVLANITGVEAGSPGRVLVYPNGREDQYGGGVVLDLASGETAADLAAVQIGNDDKLSLSASGRTHVIVDVAGYFTLPPTRCAAGCVTAWGASLWGDTGTGDPNYRSSTPRLVHGLRDVVHVAPQERGAIALLADGTAWGWGHNQAGGAGTGYGYSDLRSPMPVRIDQPLALVDNGIAVDRSGGVWQWGKSTTEFLPIRTQQLAAGTRQVQDGIGTFYALTSQGTVLSWGSNARGALGIGDTNESLYRERPGPVPGLADVVAINAYQGGITALRSDGTVWTWGDNSHGRLGTGSGDERAVAPARVTAITGATAISGSAATGYALLRDGTVRAWGSGGAGSLGNGGTADSPCRSGSTSRA